MLPLSGRRLPFTLSVYPSSGVRPSRPAFAQRAFLEAPLPSVPFSTDEQQQRPASPQSSDPLTADQQQPQHEEEDEELRQRDKDDRCGRHVASEAARPRPSRYHSSATATASLVSSSQRSTAALTVSVHGSVRLLRSSEWMSRCLIVALFTALVWATSLSLAICRPQATHRHADRASQHTHRTAHVRATVCVYGLRD